MLDLDMSFRKAAVMHVDFPKRSYLGDRCPVTEHSVILPGGTDREGASHRLPRKVVWIHGASLHLLRLSTYVILCT